MPRIKRCSAQFRSSNNRSARGGIEPRLEIREIDEQSFKAKPSESNRIWIAGKPIEEWLGASVGSSCCCSVCGTSECRTVEVEGTTFEAIPETLFVRAALIASSMRFTSRH